MQLPLEKQISFLHIKKFIFHNLYSFVFLPFDFYMTSLVFGFKEYAFINKILCHRKAVKCMIQTYLVL